MSATQQQVQDESTAIEAKLLFVLGMYPGISPTMLQAGLGPQVKPVIWRPVYERLLSEGKVKLELTSKETPLGRHQTFTRIYINDTNK